VLAVISAAVIRPRRLASAAVEGLDAGSHFIEDDAETEQIGARIEFFPSNLLHKIDLTLTCLRPCVTIRPMIAGSRCVHCGTACLDSGPIAITVWPYRQKKY
jgi:hypothetical protein